MFWVSKDAYRESPGLIEVRKHFLGGLYSGAYIQGGLHLEGILC